MKLSRVARLEHRRLTAAEGMPAATHPAIRIERDIPVPAGDGIPLMTDHWWSDGVGSDVVLVRVPYGRRDMEGVALFLAERGHHVVVQSCRGTFGSGGEFTPLFDEAADGQATLRWLRDQPWATGRVHSFGGSYFAITQWAYCDGEERPDTMSIAISARHPDEAIMYVGGGFSMDTLLTWAASLDIQRRPVLARLWALLRAKRDLARGALTVPPSDAVRAAVNHDPGYFRDWVEHSDVGDPWWQPIHFADDPSTVPPVTLVAGWQDFFLVEQINDYRELHGAGVPARLIVGDWVHAERVTTDLCVRELLGAIADGNPPSGVRVEISGGVGWRDLEAWPPASSTIERELTAAGRLAHPVVDRPAELLSYRYDPADPTPAEGGLTFNPFNAGRRDQRRRERRSDVLVFTDDVLENDLIIVGHPELELTLTSTNPRVDVFVRVCEVDAKGRSRTVTEGYRRLAPDAAPSEQRDITIALAPIAHRFAAGHRLRVQVSSGAHPLHLRNSGTEDPVRDHSRLITSDQTLLLGGLTPAILRLPKTALV